MWSALNGYFEKLVSPAAEQPKPEDSATSTASTTEAPTKEVAPGAAEPASPASEAKSPAKRKFVRKVAPGASPAAARTHVDLPEVTLKIVSVTSDIVEEPSQPSEEYA